MMTDDQLAAMEARAEAATAGPWYWRTGEKFTTRLISAKNMGQYVMTFIRRGMQSADVRFNVNGIMRSAHTISVPRREGDPDWDERTLDHPDAVFIAHARADIPALVAEVRRLQKAIDSACDKLDGVVGNVFSVGERVVRLDHLASTAHAMWAEQDGAESEGA